MLSLVSSFLPSFARPADAELAPARRAEEEASRLAAATAAAAKPVGGHPIEPVVYFHGAKHMLGRAMAGFRHDIGDAMAGLGFDDPVARELTRAVMRQTRNALLWGVGFSVKLMTAAVSETNASGGGAAAFGIAARSIEIRVNHRTGVIAVAADDVSIRSQRTGGPGEAAPHLLDMRDSEDANPHRLLAALQALRDPAALLPDDEDDLAGAAPGASSAPPPVAAPSILTRPGYGGRLMLAAMDRERDEGGALVTRLRLDAVIPLSDRPQSLPPANETAPGREGR